MMSWYNDEPNRQVRFKHGLSVKNVTGFECHPDGTVMTVEEWSPDGAHPGRDFSHPSFNEFYQELRATMYGGITKLSDAAANW